MATKKPAVSTAVAETIDLKEFRRQKELVIRQAQTQISDKVEEVKRLLADIKELVELSGIQIELGRILGDQLQSISQYREGWNSSSYEC